MVHFAAYTKLYLEQRKTTTDRGNIGVVLFNFGREDFQVSIGDRIAQLILEKVSMADSVEVNELSETRRGASGFGSTGRK